MKSDLKSNLEINKKKHILLTLAMEILSDHMMKGIHHTKSRRPLLECCCMSIFYKGNTLWDVAFLHFIE